MALSISPTQGASGGGTTVTITGTAGNMADVTSVTFGGKAGTSLTNVDANHATVVTPSGLGAEPVVATSAGGSSSAGTFYYINQPIKSTISRSAGLAAGGDVVTITGTGLQTTTGVTFGGVAGTALSVTNDGQISITTPGGTAGTTVPIVVTTAAGSTNGLYFTYLGAPTTTASSPSAGPLNGGTPVTLTGTNLDSTQSVSFGTSPAGFLVMSPTQLVAYSPSSATAGTVNINVTTPAGTDSTSTFAYQAPPG